MDNYIYIHIHAECIGCSQGYGFQVAVKFVGMAAVSGMYQKNLAVKTSYYSGILLAFS